MAKKHKQSKAKLPAMAQVEPIPSGSSKINVGDSERVLSVAGGALLATIGIRQGGLGGMLLAVLGSTIAYRGVSGYCPVNDFVGRDTSEAKAQTDVIEISQVVTINKPRAEVYQYWRHLENLPEFMTHLQSVTQIDDKRSHWVAPVPGTEKFENFGNIEWDAEITEEVENSRLVWRSVPGASIDNAGEVRFTDAPQGRGTELHAVIKYRPPQGIVGELVSKLLNPAFKSMVEAEIRRFKRLLETNSVPV
ncbi:DUF2892 domain-containing protein [Rudanella paleaurantiibacter]|uniref:DUF2892 domain-containing protein n=1 Tax=Rudanella paleaurantiibacter TaxID=2614655 RepID=A0A7J5TS82_9BACT|nr:SRPBCC family protein [Rudanella paleaurantiibacter]KAB7725986.1 DUF2892 domain-containing protein [Rudanella paleaurantiibacter]